MAQRLLANASDKSTSFGTLRVISVEGVIAFKLQEVVNDPRRTQDIEDIKALLRANRGTLNIAEGREYFRPFDRESQLRSRTRHVIAAEGGVTIPIESDRDPYERLDDLMVVVEALCPRYPDREPYKHFCELPMAHRRHFSAFTPDLHMYPHPGS